MLSRWTKLCVVSAILALSCSLSTVSAGPPHNKMVVCYISTWAVYRPGQGAYSIENFDANLCTHAIYAFAGLDVENSAIKSLDTWQDLKEDYGKGGYERLTSLKTRFKHLKVLLAIGGWNEGSKNLSRLVSSAESRGKFVKQVASFVRKYNFDGLDLDWEYPTTRGGIPQDRENFALWVKELRQEFDIHKLLLTSAIAANQNVIDAAYDISQISAHLHFLHVMAYDYHGSFDKAVGYNAPLRSVPGDTSTVQNTIDHLLMKGAPASKLVMGVPFYGRTFVTKGTGRIGDLAEGNGFKGIYTREEGFLGYNEICSLLTKQKANWTTIWDGHAAQLLAYSARNETDGYVNVVTYDNERSIANKILFAMSRKLAGVMVWSIDTDDFLGECPSTNIDIFQDFKMPQRNYKSAFKNYPLMRTINLAITVAQESISQGFTYDNQDIDDSPNNNPDIDDSQNEIPHGDNHDHAHDNKKSLANSLIQTPSIVSLLLFNAIYIFTTLKLTF